MLGSLLEKLSSLLPRSFLLAAVFPVLAFSLVNGLLAYLISATFRQRYFQFAELTPTKQALIGVPLLAGASLAFYVVSMAAVSMRQVLEGAYFRGDLKRTLVMRQGERLTEMEQDLAAARKQWFKLKRQQPSWTGRLKAARLKGDPVLELCEYSNESVAAKLVLGLLERMKREERIDGVDIDEAVSALEAELESCSLGHRPAGAADEPNKKLLNSHQMALSRDLPQYAESFAEKNYTEQYDKRDVYYSRYVTAPTAMGNIAESIRGYARSRYDLNLDPFWSRLVKVVQEDQAFSSLLSDANSRLDAAIAFLWLTLLSTFFWLGYLLYLRRNPFLFLGIGIVGPLVALACYRVALQSYLAFAEVLRTAIDLHRFKLLSALHIALPPNSEAERTVWLKLNQVIGYGMEEVIEYEHPQPEK